jgi:hypothetical protein
VEKMKNYKQHGFTVVEGLLIILVLTVVGFGGYYVWNSNQGKQEEKPASESQTTTNENNSDSQTPAAKETDSWYQHVSKSSEYKIRLADGLVFVKAEDSNPYLSLSTDSLETKEGTKAVVMERQGGRDGSTGMSVNYYETGTETKGFGSKQASFATDSGLIVDKYYYVQETEPDGLGLPKGGKQYTYFITPKDGGAVLTVQYTLDPNDNVNVELVEKMVKTVELK